MKGYLRFQHILTNLFYNQSFSLENKILTIHFSRLGFNDLLDKKSRCSCNYVENFKIPHQYNLINYQLNEISGIDTLGTIFVDEIDQKYVIYHGAQSNKSLPVILNHFYLWLSRNNSEM